MEWRPGGRLQTGENFIDSTARVEELELKKSPSPKPFVATARDPLKVNSKNVKVEFENEYVRVLRCKYAANVREPLHDHLSQGRVTVPRENVEMQATPDGAEDRTVTLTAGQPSWSP